MKLNVKTITVVIVAILCSGSYGGALQLAKNGQAAGKIILQPKASLSEKLAAKELAAYVKKISGATLPLQTTIAPNSIVLGTLTNLKDIPADMKSRLANSKSNECFYIKTVGDKLYIVGKKPVGALYGAYTLLNKLGVRWFFPGKKGEYYPQQKTIQLTAIDDFEAPSFPFRSLALTGASYDYEDAWEWLIRNKMQIQSAPDWLMRKYSPQERREYRAARNAGDLKGGHIGLHVAIPAKKYFKAHPEYFCLIDGKRTATGRYQYCLSNPNVQKLLEDYIYEQTRQGKTFLFGMHDTVKTFCQCDNCRKMGTANGKYEVTNVFHKFSSLVAQRVKKRNPNAKILTWMYSSYRPFPSVDFKYPDSIMGSYCSHNRCYAHRFDDPKCAANKKLYDDFRKWLKKAPNSYLREYIACSHNGYCPFEYIMADDLRLLKRLGAAGWADEVMPVNGRMTPENAKRMPETPFMWTANWQMYYVAAKLLWNINANVDKLLADAYDHYYGKAAPMMKKYHALRRKLWKNAPGHSWYPGPQMRSGYCLAVPGAEKQLTSYLAGAQKAAVGNPKALQHIAMDKKFLKKYWGKNAKIVRELNSAEKRIIPQKTTGKIKLDGDLTEDAWLQARPVTGFLTILNKQQPREKTNFRVLYDKDNLYFGFVASAKNTWGGKQRARATKRDGKVWSDDSVELLLAPPNQSGDFYHFMVNTKGVVYDAVRSGPGGDKKYDAKADFKIKKHGDNYIYEIKLPLAPMKMTITPGQIWGIHAVRNCRSLQAPTTSETSTLDGNMPHNKSGFRKAVFGADLIHNGNFAVIIERAAMNGKKKKDGSKYKFPKDWGAAGAAVEQYKLKKNANGNEIWYNGVIFTGFAPPKNSPGDYKFVVCAKGKGNISCRTWSWRGYKPRTHHRRLKLGSFKLTDKFKNYIFKCKALPNEGWHMFYIYGTDITVKNVSCTVQP